MIKRSVFKSTASFISPGPGMTSVLNALAAVLLFAVFSFGQAASNQAGFRIGEKITYAVSLDRLQNVAYAETYVVSQGRLGDKEAIELRGRIKTLNFVSAAYYLVDQSRTTFVSAETGLPVYIAKNENTGGLPQETIHNYLTSPTQNVDLLTLIYKIRSSGTTGAFTMQENDRTYGVTFQTTGEERVKTDVGEFDTTLVTVQSEYFAEMGIKDVRINLSRDENRIPALIRLKTDKGEFRASVSSIGVDEPETAAQPTPVPIAVPRPSLTPKPQATPTPFIDNQPLAPELAFELGETLNYSVTAGPMPVGTLTMQARERKQFNGMDSLLLEARVTAVQPGNPLFAVNDVITAQVDPETLVPHQVDIRFSGPLRGSNRLAVFERAGSLITFNGNTQVSAPVGTQSILSLLYAMRSFNLKPSRISSNPVNDTRVAVFWESQPYIFTLRPSPADLITINGERVSAQLVTVTTSNPVLDRLQIRVWLSNDSSRRPLRISAGHYQADLISTSRIEPR